MLMDTLLNGEHGCGHGHSHGVSGHANDGHGHSDGGCDNLGACNGHGQGLDSVGNGHGHCHTHGHGSHSHGADAPALAPGEPTMAASFSHSVAWLRAHDPAECPVDCALTDLADCAEARCDHSRLKESTNVIVLVRAHELTTMSRVNTMMAFLAVLYVSVNVVGCILNSYENDCDPTAPSCSPATTPQVFHNLEFWSTSIFNVVNLVALNFSPKNLSNQYENPMFLKLVVLLNVGMSFSSSVLVSINLEKFEVLSHELEYFNELTVAIFDITILLTLMRGRSHIASHDGNRLSVITLVGAVCVAVVQLGIYNLSGWTADGDSKGETAAHYLEFAFGIVSGGITFWFTMDNKMCADKRLGAIMYGQRS